MKTIHTIQELRAELTAARTAGKTIGLVPTMGALHAGHASLVRRSVAENDVTVVSIFLNPTQFNDKSDLERYPRTLEADCALLAACGAQIAFAPSVAEVYPEPDTRHRSACLRTQRQGNHHADKIRLHDARRQQVQAQSSDYRFHADRPSCAAFEFALGRLPDFRHAVARYRSDD